MIILEVDSHFLKRKAFFVFEWAIGYGLASLFCFAFTEFDWGGLELVFCFLGENLIRRE